MATRSRLAPAKINLTLHVTGQRADGYHLLDSLVVFAEAGDRVSLAGTPGFAVTGPQASALAAESDNLVTRAARLVGAEAAGLVLDKRLPVASGMGGGSSDAAAALHLLAEAHDMPLPETETLMRLGADLPVCMAAPAPCRMRGLGEQVTPLDGVPALWLVLVNPGPALSTPAVFKALQGKENPPMPGALPHWSDARALCDWLTGMRNDLEPPARMLMPVIGTVLEALRAQTGCLLARMTGSGATCFGVFTDEAAARDAEAALSGSSRFVLATRTFGSDERVMDGASRRRCP
jgi:4-diphosphocytidyl-2-C-methyl-D-erythritol kinase